MNVFSCFYSIAAEAICFVRYWTDWVGRKEMTLKLKG